MQLLQSRAVGVTERKKIRSSCVIKNSKDKIRCT